MEARFETFTALIAKASRAILKIKASEMVEFDLKSSHVSCLYYLYKHGKLTATELGKLCCEDKANISRTVKYLESNGFILCESTAKKRYQSPLFLTDEGKRVGAHITEKIDSLLDRASEGLTEAQRTVFYQSLSLICNNLENICNSYGE